MIKNKSLLSVTLLSLTLVACNGGGGGGGSSAAPAEAHTPLAYKIVQVDQDGWSNAFLPNDKTVLDLRPSYIWSYYYVYLTNNQTIPVLHVHASVPGGNGEDSLLPSRSEIVPQPNDPQDCTNISSLAIGAQCRALIRTTNNQLPNRKNQVESFNTTVNYGYCWADAQVSDGYACNSSGPGMLYWPSISIPSISGVWTQASNGSVGSPDGLTLDGSFIFAPSDLGTSSKYSITYNQNGTAWINLESPVQVFGYVGNNLNKMFTYTLQPIGQSDGVLWAQNAGGMFYDQAVYQYGANLYYSIPTWLELSDVGISKRSVFTNGLDGGLYLDGGTKTNYRFNGTSFVALNMPLCTKPGPLGCNSSVQAVAVDGTIVKSEGCFKTTDGINYTLTPFSGTVESDIGFTMWNGKVWAGEWKDKQFSHMLEVDTDKCIINLYSKYSQTQGSLPGGGFNSTPNGYFGPGADGNIAFYPPDSYWK